MMHTAIKIMMIDNDPAAHCYHKAMIEKAGLDKKFVSTYLEVDEALKKIQEDIDNERTNSIPDVILVDINMPDIDGWSFVDQLQKMKLLTLPKIYMVSNSLNKNDKIKAENSIFIQDFKQKYLDKAFFENLRISYSSFF